MDTNNEDKFWIFYEVGHNDMVDFNSVKLYEINADINGPHPVSHSELIKDDVARSELYNNLDISY